MTVENLLQWLQDPTRRPRPDRGPIVRVLRATGYKPAIDYANEVARTGRKLNTSKVISLLIESSPTPKPSTGAVDCNIDIEVQSAILGSLLRFSQRKPRHQVIVRGAEKDGYTPIKYRYPLDVNGKGVSRGNELNDFYRTLARALGAWVTEGGKKQQDARAFAKSLTRNGIVR